MAFGRNSFEKYLEPCNAVPTADPFADAHALRRAEVKRIDEGRPLSDIDWIPPHVVEMGMPPEHMQLLPWLRKGARATADSIRDQAHSSVGSPFDVDELPTDDIMTIGGEGLSLRDLYSLAVPGNCVSVKIIDVLLRELRTNTNGFFVVLPSEIMDHRNWQAIIFHNNLGPVDIEKSKHVAIPFYYEGWSLAVLDPATRIYHHYTCIPNDARDTHCKAKLVMLLHDISSWLGSDRPWVEETVACAPQAADASGVSICATAYALARNLSPHDDVPPAQDVVLRRYFLHLLSTHGNAEDGQGGNDNDDNDDNDGAPADDRVKYKLTEAQKRQADDLVKKLSKLPKRK